MIYICFGMMKSASTFLYQLVEETFRVAGRRPVRLGPPLRFHWSVENYVDDVDPHLLEAISRSVGPRDVVLKTHQGLHPEVAQRISEGSLLASVSIRDPREIALAMVDHGRRSRILRRQAEFTECRTVLDALPSLDNQIANLSEWSTLQGVEIFRYNEICFDTAAVVARVAAQIGVAVNPIPVLTRYRNQARIGQFSKGAALRYREMPPEEQAVFLGRYTKLYETFSFGTASAEALAGSQERQTLRARSELSHGLTYLSRLLRI